MVKLDNTRGAPPLYLQIKQFIKDRIKDGTYPYGSNIPTEPEFQRMFDVSRITARQAINELQLEGFVKRTRGKGSEVIFRKFIEEPLSFVKSFTDEMKEKGLEPGTSFAKVTVGKTSADVQNILQITDNHRIITVERVRTVDGEPLVYFITHVLYDEKMPEADDAYYGSLYELLDKHTGRKVSYVKEVIGATLADQKMADYLGIKKNSAILKRVRFSYDKENRPLEYTIGYYRADNYSYIITLESQLPDYK